MATPAQQLSSATALPILEQFMQQGIDSVLKKIRIRKLKVPKKKSSRSMEDREIRWHSASILQRYILPEHSRRVHKELNPSILQEGWHKNYQGITLTSIAVNISNALLLNRIELQNEKILKKN